MIEEWVPVVGLEEYYMVSSLGRVKTIKRKGVRERIKQPSVWKNGYLRMNLYFDGESKFMYVHRLVAIAFLGDQTSSQLEVNHIDEDKSNNKLSNLEWVTRQKNVCHGSRLHKIRKPVVKVSPIDGSIEAFEGAYKAGELGFDTGHIAKVCKKESKTHMGFEWYYVEDYYNLSK